MPTEYREVRITLPRMHFVFDDEFVLCTIPAGAKILSLPSLDDVMRVMATGGTLTVSYEIDVHPPMTVSYEIAGAGPYQDAERINNEESTKD